MILEIVEVDENSFPYLCTFPDPLWTAVSSWKLFLLNRMKGSGLGWNFTNNPTQVVKSNRLLRSWDAACLVFVYEAQSHGLLYLLQLYYCSITAGASLCLLHKRKWKVESCLFFLTSRNFSLLTITVPSKFLS